MSTPIPAMPRYSRVPRRPPDAFRGGSEAAKGFLDILLGTQQFAQYGSTSFRTGGLVGALQAFGQAAMETAKQIGIAIGQIQGFFAHPGVDTSPGWGFLDPGNPRNIWNGDPLGVGKGGHAAGGWVGLNGPEISLLGERGPEYVVPNHALGGMGGGGGPTINLHFDFLSMPSSDQLRKVTAEVSRIMYYQLNHAPVTSNPAGSF